MCVCVCLAEVVHPIGPERSVLIQGWGAIGGPEELDVRPLGL